MTLNDLAKLAKKHNPSERVEEVLKNKHSISNTPSQLSQASTEQLQYMRQLQQQLQQPLQWPNYYTTTATASASILPSSWTWANAR